MKKLGFALVLAIALSSVPSRANAGSAPSPYVEFHGCRGVTQDHRTVIFDANRLATFKETNLGGPGRIQTYAAKNPEGWLKPTMIFEGVDSLDQLVHSQTLTEVQSKEVTTIDAGKCPGSGSYKTKFTKFTKLYTIQERQGKSGWQPYKLKVTCQVDDYIRLCDPCKEPGADPDTCGE